MKKQNKKTEEAHISATVNGRIVLVGTYKGDQLTKWRGWYNYPISGNGELGTGNGRDALVASDFAKINELWLFKGKKDQRNYKAQFVGVKTRQELVGSYGYPAKGKAHGDKYLLFKTERLYHHRNAPQKEADAVIVRTKDFAKRTPKVATHKSLLIAVQP